MEDYQLGLMSTQDFCQQIADKCSSTITPIDIEQAWNSICLNIAKHKLEAIRTLNANPDETIFIDDNVENIAAASSCELQTLPAGYRLAHYLLLDFSTKAAKISAFGKDEARSVRCVK